MVIDCFRQEHVRNRKARVLARQEHHLVRSYFRFQGRRVLHALPLWEELVHCAGLEHISTQNVRSNMGSFLDQTNRNVLVMLLT